jgi:hypothetical protein
MSQRVKSVVLNPVGDVGFTPESDRDRYVPDGRFVPLATKVQRSKKALFNHLVGACEQWGRHGKAERLGGFKIDTKLIFVRRLHWQIRRFSPLRMRST